VEQKQADEAAAFAEAKAGKKAEAEARAKAETEAKAKAEAEAKGKDGKKTAVTVRHKTPHRNYRCAGLVLAQQAEQHMVNAAQLERLRRDHWVELTEPKAANG